MPLIVTCPKCGAKMRAPDNSIGRQARCPGCGDLVTITGPDGLPAAEPTLYSEAALSRLRARNRDFVSASR